MNWSEKVAAFRRLAEANGGDLYATVLDLEAFGAPSEVVRAAAEDVAAAAVYWPVERAGGVR